MSLVQSAYLSRQQTQQPREDERNCITACWITFCTLLTQLSALIGYEQKFHDLSLGEKSKLQNSICNLTLVILIHNKYMLNESCFSKNKCLENGLKEWTPRCKKKKKVFLGMRFWVILFSFVFKKFFIPWEHNYNNFYNQKQQHNDSHF